MRVAPAAASVNEHRDPNHREESQTRTCHEWLMRVVALLREQRLIDVGAHQMTMEVLVAMNRGWWL